MLKNVVEYPILQTLSATKYFIEDCSVYHELKKLDSFSDLGVEFDNKLTFLEHMNKKLTKLTAF